VAGYHGAVTMVVDGRELLVQLRQRLQQIKNRLVDIEARLDASGSSAANEPMTLREFTEKKLKDKSPDVQETDSSNPRAAAKKYSTR
jgi:BMFP domain-containing protein YqiC